MPARYRHVEHADDSLIEGIDGPQGLSGASRTGERTRCLSLQNLSLQLDALQADGCEQAFHGVSSHRGNHATRAFIASRSVETATPSVPATTRCELPAASS